MIELLFSRTVRFEKHESGLPTQTTEAGDANKVLNRCNCFCFKSINKYEILIFSHSNEARVSYSNITRPIETNNFQNKFILLHTLQKQAKNHKSGNQISDKQ